MIPQLYTQHAMLLHTADYISVQLLLYYIIASFLYDVLTYSRIYRLFVTFLVLIYHKFRCTVIFKSPLKH